VGVEVIPLENEYNPQPSEQQYSIIVKNSPVQQQ
jgi:hypothetical protein